MRSFSSLGRDEQKSREQLIAELDGLRARVSAMTSEKSGREAGAEELYLAKCSVDAAHDPIIWITPDGGHKYCNDASCRALGYSREELLALHVWDINPSITKNNWLHCWNKLKNQGTTTNEWINKRKDGTEFPVLAVGHYVTYNGKEYLFAYIRDVSNRRRSEEALRRSENNLARAQEIARLGSFDRDLANQVITWSDEAYRIFKLDPAETKLTWELFHTMIHPDDLDTILAIDRESVTHKTPFKAEYRIVLRDGSIRWIRGWGQPIFNEQGILVCHTGTMLDITERKQADEERERLLREIDGQRRRLGAILDSVPVGIVIVDAGCDIVLYNQIAQSYFPGSDTRNFQDVAHIRYADTGKTLEYAESGLARALSKGETTVSEAHELERSDGTRFTLLHSVAPLKDDNGITGAIIVSQDITERIGLEKELGEAKKQAELYLDLVTHDINNLNQVAMGYLELAGLEYPDKELISKPLDVLRSGAELIDSVHKLRKAREDASRAEVIDLEGILAELQKEYDLPDKGIVINFERDQGCRVLANGLVKDVFANLVGNAIKHSGGNRPVEIAIKLDRVQDGDKDYCRVAVEDNGPGIPDDLKDKLFGRFQRGKTMSTGKGLGLYLVKTLVEGYHGRVWAEDRVPGDHTQGARFVVLLPAARDQSK